MSEQIKLPYKLLIYDIENGKLKARIFPSSKPQYINHKQLCHGHKVQPIICIGAKFYGQKKIHMFTGPDAVEEFTKLAKTADVVLGKNNYRFDDKHVNTQRLIEGLTPAPELKFITDDLETQLRNNFNFASYSLDFVAEILVGKGKDKMEDSDWNDIQDLFELERIQASGVSGNELNKVAQVLYGRSSNVIFLEGRRAFNKMCSYNKTDLVRTEQVYARVIPYVKLKMNSATLQGQKGDYCTTCGSRNVKLGKLITVGQSRFQLFDCLTHKGYAGRRSVTLDKYAHKRYGKMS